MQPKLSTCCVHCFLPATVFVTFVEAGQSAHCAYCAVHAATVGLLDGKGYDLLGSSHKPAEERPDTVCPHCGMKRSDLVARGRLGCARCYEVFAAQIQPLLGRLHMGTKHAGKVPRKVRALRLIAQRILALTRQMERASEQGQAVEARVLGHEIERMRQRAAIIRGRPKSLVDGG